MARRNKGDEETVSLFPFLSILACLIGTLTMMITAMAMSQMSKDEPQSDEEIAAAEARLAEFKKLQTGLADAKIKEQELRDLIHDAEELRKDEQKLKELRQKALMAQVATNEQEGVSVILAQIQDLTSEIKEIEPKLKVSKAELEKLSKEMDARKNPQARISIIGGGSGTGLNPEFVECATNQIVIHLDAGPVEVSSSDIRKSSDFDAFLENIKKDESKSVVFLIREDGSDVYNSASRYASDKGVRNGKLPIIGQGEIDLGFFRGK